MFSKKNQEYTHSVVMVPRGRSFCHHLPQVPRDIPVPGAPAANDDKSYVLAAPTAHRKEADYICGVWLSQRLRI